MGGADWPAGRAAAASVLSRLRAPFVLLEDRLDRAAPARLYRDPLEVVRCDDPQDAEAAIARVEAAVAGGLHAAGFLAYELGYALEPALRPRMLDGMLDGRDTPLLWFGLFNGPESLAARDLDAALADAGPPPPISGLTAGLGRAEYRAKIEDILRLIRAGDVYQVNQTFPMTFGYAGSPLALYAALRARQPVAHGSLIGLDDRAILSVSPELFVEVAEGCATVRPMKGTAARGAEPRADAQAREALAADPKQRAENLMIVDLLRNDLSRISAPGSVRTPALFTVESFPTFHTLTSTITARLRPDAGLRERIAALFPCGSIVGEPKIRAAEIIADLEAAPRGVYTGAIGVIAPGGTMRFSVAIRTAVVTEDGRGRYGVGGGIVADSDPDAEYDEALLKARVLSDLATDYGLIETLRWSSDRGFIRLERHLDRLCDSARRLGFRLDRADGAQALADAARAWSGAERRVRLVLAREGAIAITSEPATAPAEGPTVGPTAGPLRVGLATVALDAADPFLRHKTTQRAPYEQAFAEAAAQGLDEAVLLNRDGLIADGSRNSVFLARDGRLVTPHVAAGALPGVLRAELIASGQAVEGDIRPQALRGAEAWFLGNSLHGLRRARLV